MFTVYALHSPEHDKIYIGYTSNLEQRLLSHNELGTKGWTVHYRPWELVHSEEFASKAEAMKRERQLKSAQGRAFIWGFVNQTKKFSFFFNTSSCPLSSNFLRFSSDHSTTKGTLKRSIGTNNRARG